MLSCVRLVGSKSSSGKDSTSQQSPAILDNNNDLSNKNDLANPNIIIPKWIPAPATRIASLLINAHSKTSVSTLLELVEFKLREVIPREPTLLVLVVGVPNVGKSALINSIHQIASSRFPVQEKMKRATVGPLPGVTQDIAGYKPSIYVLDTPGVLVPSIPDIETRLKLALAEQEDRSTLTSYSDDDDELPLSSTRSICVRASIPSGRDDNLGHLTIQSVSLEPLGQNLQLRVFRAVRCLILSDKEVNLGHSATNNVRRLVRRPSIPSNRHFRFSQSYIIKNRRESKQPTAFSDKQMRNFCSKGGRLGHYRTLTFGN
nr:short integuments 2, mitochondrial [Quercus suber]